MHRNVPTVLTNYLLSSLNISVQQGVITLRNTLDILAQFSYIFIFPGPDEDFKSKLFIVLNKCIYMCETVIYNVWLTVTMPLCEGQNNNSDGFHKKLCVPRVNTSWWVKLIEEWAYNMYFTRLQQIQLILTLLFVCAPHAYNKTNWKADTDILTRKYKCLIKVEDKWKRSINVCSLNVGRQQLPANGAGTPRRDYGPRQKPQLLTSRSYFKTTPMCWAQQNSIHCHWNDVVFVLVWRR